MAGGLKTINLTRVRYSLKPLDRRFVTTGSAASLVDTGFRGRQLHRTSSVMTHVDPCVGSMTLSKMLHSVRNESRGDHGLNSSAAKMSAST